MSEFQVSNARRIGFTVLALVAVWIAAMGCRGPERGAPISRAPIPTSYDDLLAYVPAGMESVLVFDLDRKGWPKEVADHYAGKIQRGMFAGRRFLYPSGEGIGEFDGVSVVETPSDIKTLMPDGESEHMFSYGVADVRRVKARAGTPLFFAQVAPAQMLYATSEKSMRAALQRNGPSGRILAKQMGWSDGVPWGSPLVLLRKPDSTIRDHESGPNRRAAVWVASKIQYETSRVRVAGLVVYSTNASRLEFEARVQTVGGSIASRVPERPCLDDGFLGALYFLASPAGVDGDVLILRGNLRSLFKQGPQSIAPLVVFGMLGVRIII